MKNKRNFQYSKNYSKLLTAILIIAAVSFLPKINLSKNETVSEVKANFSEAKATKDDRLSVCLDPGHGEEDLGATNYQINERDLNLSVANEVKKILESANYRVVMTRTDDGPNLENIKRAELCNAAKTDILVSIHHNDYAYDSRVDYTSGLYNKEADVGLVTTIVDSVANKLKLPNNGIETIDSNLLGKSEMPAALIESFFISNRNEYYILSTYGHIKIAEEAESIAEGIKTYFENN